MPSHATRCRAVFACAAAAAALAAAAPAALATGASASDQSCPAAPVAQPFAAWQDVADYVLAPAGDVEDGAASWTLTGAAAAVEGNEPFAVGGADDHLALSIPGDATATTAAMCVGADYPSLRFFARGSGTLRVDALHTGADGITHVKQLAKLDGSADWAATDAIALKVDRLAAAQDETKQVALRFSAGAGADWTIDDVYVDPYRVR